VIRFLLFAMALLSVNAHAEDDLVQCKRNVNMFIDGQKFMREPGAVAKIKQWRASGMSDCDIQQRLIGTRAEKPLAKK